jgi:hypothetical protein
LCCSLLNLTPDPLECRLCCILLSIIIMLLLLLLLLLAAWH